MVRTLKTLNLFLVILAVLSLASCAALLKKGDIDRTVPPSSGDLDDGTTPGDDGGDDGDVTDKSKCDVCEASLLDVSKITTIEDAVNWHEILAKLNVEEQSAEIIDLTERLDDLVKEAIAYPDFSDGKMVGDFYGSYLAPRVYFDLCYRAAPEGASSSDSSLVPFGPLDIMANYFSGGPLLTMDKNTILKMTTDEAKAALAAVNRGAIVEIVKGEFSKVNDSLKLIANDYRNVRSLQLNEFIKGGTVVTVDPKAVFKPAFFCTFCNVLLSSFKNCNNLELVGYCNSAQAGTLFTDLVEDINTRLKEISNIVKSMEPQVRAILEAAITDAQNVLDAYTITCKAEGNCSEDETKRLQAIVDAAKAELSAFNKDPITWMSLYYQPYIDLIKERVELQDRLNLISKPCA